MAKIVRATEFAKERTDSRPFFVLEQQISLGHMGGGMVTVEDDKDKGRFILWGVGDCLPHGMDGHYVPQLDTGACGKMIIIVLRIINMLLVQNRMLSLRRTFGTRNSSGL